MARNNHAVEFQSTLSLRRATACPLVARSAFAKFQSTLSLRRATTDPQVCQIIHIDFNPRSPCGERRASTMGCYQAAIFQSTLSLRRATLGTVPTPFKPVISIHALLAESDLDRWQHQSQQGISIHALLAESDACPLLHGPSVVQFQSTLSLRRATDCDGLGVGGPADFNPRSPCGERPITAPAMAPSA